MYGRRDLGRGTTLVLLGGPEECYESRGARRSSSMRVATIIIRRPSGEFFVHQRSADRKLYPNLYGLGAGGKVGDHETPQMGAARELFEETRLGGSPEELFSFNFADDCVSHQLTVFELVTSDAITPDPREWQWSGWMDRSALEVLEHERRLCPDTAVFFRRYLTFCEERDRLARRD